MLDGKTASGEAHSPRATQFTPATPERTLQYGNDMSRGRPKSACDSFFTEDGGAARTSPESSQSIHHTRSPARNSSLLASASSKDIGASSSAFSTPFRGRAEPSVGIDVIQSTDQHSSLLVSESSKDIGTSSPTSSTPYRYGAESNAKTNVTPHLDHVLLFHQKVSPPAFAHDIFTSFALEADTSESHDSVYSYFGNWRFYSPGPRDAVGGEIPPNSSEEASLSDNDSSEEGHQVVLLRPYALPSAAKSVPSLSGGNVIQEQEAKAGKFCAISRKRSKSLSALPAGSRRGQAKVYSVTAFIRDHKRTFSMNSSYEAMHFASCTPEISEADTTVSSLATYELVGNFEKSARNGKRAIMRSKLIIKPLEKLQKAVNRLLA